MSVFVNISNHPSDRWSDDQRRAALQIADQIIDLPFPNVPPEASTKEAVEIGLELLMGLPEGTVAAMVQGEFTLTTFLVRALQMRGVTPYAATTERRVEELPDGRKVTQFRFVQFRRYPDLLDPHC